jgi:membrane associated rhomboid family serine protease
MLPIRDTIRSRTFPIVNWVIVIANVLVFLYEVSLSSPQLDRFIHQFGLVTAQVDSFNPLTWYPFFTHMFLHGGWFHLLSNMWILVIFGDNIEDRLGSDRYLAFYLLGGLIAGMVQFLLGGDPRIPSIGASGAVAAVLGGYLFFYPRARVITLIMLFIFPWFVELPAVIFLGFWFLTQLYSGLASLASTSVEWGGVAWWAHIGGFMFGLLIARMFGIGRKQQRWYPDEYYPY